MLELTGKTFGRLTVIKRQSVTRWGNVTWLCKCSCGNTHVVASDKLVTGKTKSCGCLAKETHTKQLTKHGLTIGGKPRTFIIWSGIKARCLNPLSVSYKSYGARGIKICKEWLSFQNFHNWAISNGYKDNLSIDRIDVNEDYSPENCRWVTVAENRCIQRRYTILTVNNTNRALGYWANILKVNRSCIRRFFNENGKEATEAQISECLKTGHGQNKFLKKTVQA